MGKGPITLNKQGSSRDVAKVLVKRKCSFILWGIKIGRKEYTV
jgi:hypothetical protein